MTDFSSQRGVIRHMPVRTMIAESFGTYLHLLRLLWQIWGSDERTIIAVLKDGSVVQFDQGYSTDGTTFVVKRKDGTLRRVPASTVHHFEDRHDWGY